MTHKVVVIGHADADGHIIAEQVRRNLSLIKSFEVHAVVDPLRTQNHKAWNRLDSMVEIDDADYVFFVDMMFGSMTYAEEARALIEFVKDRPQKQFFLIDHHPIPIQRLSAAENLHAQYRPDVAECAIGPRTGMMVVAALCEKQPSAAAAEVKNELHQTLAVGAKRAAALGGSLPGEKLSALLRANRWDTLWELGREASTDHYLPRGRRPASRPESAVLKEMLNVAETILSDPHSGKNANAKGKVMSYDVDVGMEQLSYNSGRYSLDHNVEPSSKDLGLIVTSLEIAALILTTAPGVTFTLEQLIEEASKLAGLRIDEADVKIVLGKASFLKKTGKEYCLR